MVFGRNGCSFKHDLRGNHKQNPDTGYRTPADRVARIVLGGIVNVCGWKEEAGGKITDSEIVEHHNVKGRETFYDTANYSQPASSLNPF